MDVCVIVTSGDTAMFAWFDHSLAPLSSNLLIVRKSLLHLIMWCWNLDLHFSGYSGCAIVVTRCGSTML